MGWQQQQQLNKTYKLYTSHMMQHIDIVILNQILSLDNNVLTQVKDGSKYARIMYILHINNIYICVYVCKY